MQFVRENFVPVAVDKQELIHSHEGRRRHADDLPLVEKFTGGATANLAVHLVTADGVTLTDKQIFRQSTADEVLATLREAIERFGPVTRRNVAPTWQQRDRGGGVRADGTVRLATSIRFTDADDHRGRPVFDSLVLAAEDWRALQPPRRTDGMEYAIARTTAAKFALMLSASADPSNALRPEDLTAVSLSGTVRAMGNEAGWIVFLRGTLQGSRRYVNGTERLPAEAQLKGFVRLDAQGTPRELLVVSQGTFKMPWEPSLRPTGAVIEWRADD